MKEQTIGLGRTSGRLGGGLPVLDAALSGSPLSQEDIAAIAKRRRQTQLELRRRIDEGEVADNG
jgi:hypothetical protein